MEILAENANPLGQICTWCVASGRHRVKHSRLSRGRTFLMEAFSAEHNWKIRGGLSLIPTVHAQFSER